MSGPRDPRRTARSPEGSVLQRLLGRSGRCWLVASGTCAHAGVSHWPAVDGRDSCNRFTLGIEAENDGVGEPWPAAQLDAYARLCAAMVRGLALDGTAVRAHREVAVPAGRKIDPAGPWEGGGSWADRQGIEAFRDRVAAATFGRGERDVPEPQTITDVAEAPAGGWYEVQADGGVFAQDCPFHGSLPGIPGLAPRTMGVDHVVGIVVTGDGGGYWLAGRDGSVFAFGSAPFHGADPTLGDVAGIVRAGAGYALIRDGHGRVAFGAAPAVTG